MAYSLEENVSKSSYSVMLRTRIHTRICRIVVHVNNGLHLHPFTAEKFPNRRHKLLINQSSKMVEVIQAFPECLKRVGRVFWLRLLKYQDFPNFWSLGEQDFACLIKALIWYSTTTASNDLQHVWTQVSSPGPFPSKSLVQQYLKIFTPSVTIFQFFLQPWQRNFKNTSIKNSDTRQNSSPAQRYSQSQQLLCCFHLKSAWKNMSIKTLKL